MFSGDNQQKGIKIELSGKPIAKKRPRLSRGKTYDEQSKEKKSAKMETLKQLRDQRVLRASKSKIGIDMTFHTALPKTWAQKRKERELGEFNPRRPDLDNYVKFYCDVFNGLLYEDDSQVVQMNCRKVYSDNPRTEVFIKGIANG